MSFAYGGVGGAAPISAYGGAFSRVPEDMVKKVVFIPSRRVRVNALAICMNILCPWLLFTSLLWVMIFDTHYSSPHLAWFAVMSAFGLSAVMAGLAYNRRQQLNGDPAWYTYAAGAFFAAALVAAVFGDWVFQHKMNSYYDFETLNTYSGVNPMRTKGQMVMDSGRVYFSMYTHLDQKKTMAFKHVDNYCVVPITAGDEKLPNYDFWAVGTNCCGGSTGEFHCGRDWDNFRARSGLRLMDETQSPFYRLAVQQAEAAYGISASHPVFYHWVQDPVAEIHHEMAFGHKAFVIAAFTHFIANFCAVIYATFAFAKMTP